MKESELVINALKTIFNMELVNPFISNDNMIFVEFENGTIAQIIANDLI